MHLQIRKVVLWPRLENTAPRIVEFEAGMVNVITGASKTGKSAIIPIIDYCLASDKCTIPVGTIRHACAWFGVLVETPFGQRLLARREPENQKATGDMYVLSGVSIEIPVSIPGPNTTVVKVKADLNEVAGLTQLDFNVDGTESGFLSRPSFRDVIAFCFQPQNIVANPDVLLYKADTNAHREKLRTIFPYVLGAVTPQTLAIQHEVHRLRTELKRKDRELETARSVSQRWIAEIQSKVSIARELGLLTTDRASASVEDMVTILRDVIALPLDSSVVTTAAVDETTSEILLLEREETRISGELAHYRRRLTEMKRLQETSQNYKESLEIRRDRLDISGWMRGLHAEGQKCPVCGSEDEHHGELIEGLFTALQQIEDDAGHFERMPAPFDREYVRIQAELDRATDDLNGVRIRRKALVSQSREAERQRYASLEAARFVGTLDEAVARYELLQEDGELATETRILRERLAKLEDQLRRRETPNAISNALQTVSRFTARVLPLLDVESPELPVVISIDDLSVKVSSENRDDYLWEIGSGANWLGYHIAVILGLHSLFLSLKHSPVPSFAVFDQPSQVYFPKRLARSESGDEEQKYRDEDVDAVRKIFDALAFGVLTFKGQWQAIVLDHAPEDLWAGIEGVHMVEEWRNGEKLVPEAWLDSA